MQERDINQPQGWLEDVRTLESDNILLDRADAGVIETMLPDYSREDYLRTSKISAFFSAVVRYKNWKVGEMKRQGLDVNSVEDQRKVILADWHPSLLSKDRIAKFILDHSGGGASEAQRNTVKPVERKTP